MVLFLILGRAPGEGRTMAAGGRLPKLLGYYTFTDVEFTAELTSGGGGGPHTVELTSGDYYPSGAGALDAGDAIYRLELDIGTADVTDLGNISVSIDSDGYVTMTAGAGETIQIVWTGAEAFRNWLGYESEGSSMDITDAGLTASERVDLTFYSTWSAQIDEPEDEVIESSSKALGGQIYAVKIAEHQRVEFGLVFPGHWRSSDDDQYQRLRRLFREHILNSRRRIRLYIDASVSGAYDADSNPYGYLVVQLDPDQRRWKARSQTPRHRIRYEASWMFAIYQA